MNEKAETFFVSKNPYLAMTSTSLSWETLGQVGIKRNFPPKLGGVAASTASRRGWFQSRIFQDFGMRTTPPRSWRTEFRTYRTGRPFAALLDREPRESNLARHATAGGVGLRYALAYTRTVDVHIVRLRHKVEDDPKNPTTSSQYMVSAIDSTCRPSTGFSLIG
jgi:hypothetical protein